jgi:hypothetical protein
MGGGGTRSQQQQGLWAVAVFRNPPYVGTWDDRERIKPVKKPDWVGPWGAEGERKRCIVAPSRAEYYSVPKVLCNIPIYI